MTRHRTSHDIGCMPFLNGMVTSQFIHTALNLVKRKNLIATWHWCQLDRNCDHQISISIRVKCWWYRVFFRQRTIVDADYRGGWTHIFGGKASELETSGPVVKRNFYLPICISRPCCGWCHRNFVDNRRYLSHKKLNNPWAIVQRCLCDPTCSHSGLWQTKWQTDGQTDMRWQQISRNHSVVRAKITFESLQ